MNKTPALIIMRGWPGSGKTYLAERLAETKKAALVVSADKYWYIKDFKTYQFDAAELPQAHAYCKGQFIMGIVMMRQSPREYNKIIVDNTNIKREHYQWYIDNGNLFGLKSYQLEANAPWKYDAVECANRNVHSVPQKTIERMMQQYEVDKELPHWEVLT